MITTCNLCYTCTIHTFQHSSFVEKVLKNYDYKGEFLDALLKIEEKQKKQSALLITNEAEYTKSLQARKGKPKN